MTKRRENAKTDIPSFTNDVRPQKKEHLRVLTSRLIRCQRKGLMFEEEVERRKHRWSKEQKKKKKSSKTILPWHTKGISGLRENRLQLFLPKSRRGNVYNPVHLVYHIDTRRIWNLVLKKTLLNSLRVTEVVKKHHFVMKSDQNQHLNDFILSYMRKRAQFVGLCGKYEPVSLT